MKYLIHIPSKQGSLWAILVGVQSAACPVVIRSSHDMNHAICAKYSAPALSLSGDQERVIQVAALALWSRTLEAHSSHPWVALDAKWNCIPPSLAPVHERDFFAIDHQVPNVRAVHST